jgi:hypothetical protein
MDKGMNEGAAIQLTDASQGTPRRGAEQRDELAAL